MLIYTGQSSLVENLCVCTSIRIVHTWFDRAFQGLQNGVQTSRVTTDLSEIIIKRSICDRYSLLK